MDGVVYFDFDNKLCFVDSQKNLTVLDGIYGFPSKIIGKEIVCNSLSYKGPMLKDCENLLWIDKDKQIKKSLVLKKSQHHDYILEDESIIYLSHNPILYNDIPLLDEQVIEIDFQGNLLFEWSLAEHLDYFNLSNSDWMWIKSECELIDGYVNYAHCNSISRLGDNPWHDLGDIRFKPDNLLVSSRQLSTMFIIDKDTKNIVWSLGKHNQRANLLQTFGQHNPYMLSNGNIIVFDNGSQAGYNIVGPKYSRVLEINPVSLELVWSYENPSGFYSRVVSNAIRLINTDTTLICDGCNRHIFEVDKNKNILWDFYLPKDISKNYSKFIYRIGYLSEEEFSALFAN